MHRVALCQNSQRNTPHSKRSAASNPVSSEKQILRFAQDDNTPQDDRRRAALHIRPMQSRRWYQSSAVRALIGLVLGLIVGIAIASSNSSAARSFARTLEPI